jgi:hypothetical protein
MRAELAEKYNLQDEPQDQRRPPPMLAASHDGDSGSPDIPEVALADERLIGTLRRDCLDHVVMLSEQHLRQVLKSYALYYNEARTHLGLSKGTPLPRTIQCSGIISATPVLSGLHHRYARI